MSASLDEYASHAVTDPADRRAKSRFVQRLFDTIAPRYDLLNHVLSLGLDLTWRARAARSLDPRHGERILDLCAGTGDLAMAIASLAGRRGDCVGAGRPRGSGVWSPESGSGEVGDHAGHADHAEHGGWAVPAWVLALDFSRPMLDRFAVKQRGSSGPPAGLVCGDGLALPFVAGCFDGACCAFGVRNLADPRAGLMELARVVRPGGRLVILEFSRPAGVFGWIYDGYFRYVLPAIGALVSGVRGPYSYLPASVAAFPGPPEFELWLREAGFAQVQSAPLTCGIVTLYVSRRVPAGA